jgi:hypothetical protein
MPPHKDCPARAPVTAADVTLAARYAVTALGHAPAQAWGNQAGSLEWDCWETVEHIADGLFAYATQLTPATPAGSYVPIAMTSTRPDGARSAIHVDRENGPMGLLQAVEACGALLVAMITTSSPGTRAWHPQGTSDPEGFAAMGVTETLIHGPKPHGAHDLQVIASLTWVLGNLTPMVRRHPADKEPADDGAPIVCTFGWDVAVKEATRGRQH